MRLIVVCVFLMICTSVSGILNETIITFIRDYFKCRQVRVIASFTCTKYDSYQLAKSLASSPNFWIISQDSEKSVSTLLKSVMKRSYHRYGVFLDYDCEASQKYLNESSAGLFLNGSFNWLVWSKQSFPSSIKKLNLNIDSEFVWANPESTNGNVVMHDLYKINYSNPMNVTYAGEWNKKSGIMYTLTQYIVHRRQNMQEAVFRAGLVVNNIPTEHIEEELLKPKNKKLDTMATYNWVYFLFLKQMYNFTQEIRVTNSFGLVVDGVDDIDGLALMLRDKEIDFGINSYVMNRKRILATDYTSTATWDFRICALFRHPAVTTKFGVLLKPFEPTLWLGCGIVWVIMMAAMRFISYFEAKYDKANDQHVKTGLEGAWTWSDTFLITMGALSQQGTTQMDSEWITGRIVFLNTHILALMMSVFYSAFIVSSLLSAPPRTIKNTRDLIDSSLEFGAEDISYEIGYFGSALDPLVQELYRKKMAPPKKGYYQRSEGIHKVLTERFVFHTEANNAFPIMEQTFTDQAKCDLTEILVFPIDRGYMPVPYGSPFKERITYSFRKFIEGGLVNHQNQRWLAPKPPCSVGEEIPPVAANTVAFALWLQIGGITTSLVSFIFELLIGNRYTRAFMKKHRMKFKLQPIFWND